MIIFVFKNCFLKQNGDLIFYNLFKYISKKFYIFFSFNGEHLSCVMDNNFYI